MRLPAILFFITLFTTNIHGKLLINEFVTNTDDDWVELKLTDETSLDISNLFVTMYYGTNEPLATSQVTIYSNNRPETDYDDRYVVVHLADAITPDETDATGDTNGNGHLDIYCDNYYASLWNTEGVVAIDSDDSPSNGGILDFVSYSNRDGTPNKTMAKYTKNAIINGEWLPNSDDTQGISVTIGEDGLESYLSISRTSDIDSNSASDFVITKFQTPGAENIISQEGKEKPLFTLRSTRLSSKNCSDVNIYLLLEERAYIKIRIFSSIGTLLYSSPYESQLYPGLHKFRIPHNTLPVTGMYIGIVECSSTQLKKIETKKIFIVAQRDR